MRPILLILSDQKAQWSLTNTTSWRTAKNITKKTIMSLRTITHATAFIFAAPMMASAHPLCWYRDASNLEAQLDVLRTTASDANNVRKTRASNRVELMSKDAEKSSDYFYDELRFKTS